MEYIKIEPMIKFWSTRPLNPMAYFVRQRAGSTNFPKGPG